MRHVINGLGTRVTKWTGPVQLGLMNTDLPAHHLRVREKGVLAMLALLRFFVGTGGSGEH